MFPIIRPPIAPRRPASAGAAGGHAPHRRGASRSIAAAAVTGVLAVAALAGCSSSSTLDTARIETSIGADLGKAGLSGSVHCPTPRPVLAGDTFACTVDLAGGGQLTYDVTQRSDRGEASYELAPGQLVTGSVVADELTRTVQDETRNAVAVTCPPSALTPGGAGTIDCTMTAGSTSLEVTVALRDGHVAGWDRRA